MGYSFVHNFIGSGPHSPQTPRGDSRKPPRSPPSNSDSRGGRKPVARLAQVSTNYDVDILHEGKSDLCYSGGPGSQFSIMRLIVRRRHLPPLCSYFGERSRWDHETHPFLLPLPLCTFYFYHLSHHSHRFSIGKGPRNVTSVAGYSSAKFFFLWMDGSGSGPPPLHWFHTRGLGITGYPGGRDRNFVIGSDLEARASRPSVQFGDGVHGGTTALLDRRAHCCFLETSRLTCNFGSTRYVACAVKSTFTGFTNKELQVPIFLFLWVCYSSLYIHTSDLE